MLELVFIFSLAVFPALFSRLFWRKLTQRWQDRLTRACESPIQYQPIPVRINSPCETPSTPQAWLGDPRCRFSARSPYLRCAVNPQGPCQGCSQFQPLPYPLPKIYN
ncbi:DUF6464 family protein [Spirulina subsalsa FACHB-351]|uniref:DUF6464 family protein n=1 Tax=Spirulina subsalsa FACHB-351 TaxID=234711 RepID=A0ABT3L7T8_9CYAN|nr:DUF6464 family protein [Spirulina subsalsa]MCW6037242.1 DUF6464 family protein [Spirulina subsalsa FACHB-351]